jgi:TPR repeat protein
MRWSCVRFILLMAMICRGVDGDDKPLLDDLTASAQRGDAGAQLSLAVRYRDGKGVDKDYPQAMHWAHIAADHGNAKAMDFIGFAYLTGRGVEQNADVAFGYFHAAAGESARGAFNLGQCYFGAQGTDQDIPKALDAWKKAADMGEGRAAAEAAMVYLSGEGVPPDPQEARRLATRSNSATHPAWSSSARSSSGPGRSMVPAPTGRRPHTSSRSARPDRLCSRTTTCPRRKGPTC